MKYNMFCILNIYKEHIKSANSRAKAPVLCNTPPTLALQIAIENFLPGRNSQQEWQAVKKWTSSISWNRSGQTSISESKNSSNFRFFSNIYLTEFFLSSQEENEASITFEVIRRKSILGKWKCLEI